MNGHMDFGIDLGTTNSCVARWEGDSIRVFQNNDLMNVTPSVVRFLKNGRIIIGKRAYNAVVDDPENVAAEFKRWMGHKDRKKFPASGREMSPEELSAEILKSLRDDVRRATGQSFSAAVITVPAAFGTLQCDATSRAAHLAGIVEYILLQEPIAAATAYGVSAEARDQRWLIYDLGGGTLDIAVISTRDGRLAVLAHRGDNLLGGKDIDRKLVETYLIPALAGEFKLPAAETNPVAYQLLVRRLTIKAEEAKIELSTTKDAIVSLFDIGDDINGKPMEIEMTLNRTDLERVFDPIMRRTFQLADEALADARMAGTDLNRILLVGGPTQMPYLRTALSEHLKAPVDHSLDPMTVVARGAAIYAATVEVERTDTDRQVPPGAVTVQLAYEPVSAATETTIAGKIKNNGGSKNLEVRIESQAGFWTSGWIPVVDGYFEATAVLQQGKICPFYLYVRDQSGHTIEAEPNEFTIRHGLELSAPPLPHTVSVEVVRPNGRVELDPIFPRNTPLPAEKRIQYRADRTLRPAEASAALAVKLWEGEEFADPEVNEWVGNVQITSSMIKRPIPENSELDLFIRIDASRLITVEMFVPHLNQHFSDGVYLAEQEQRDDEDAAAALNKEISVSFDRMSVLEAYLTENPNRDAEGILSRLSRSVQDLDIEVAHAAQQQALNDPDHLRRLSAAGRDLRAQITGFEQRVGVDRFFSKRAEHAQSTIEDVQKTVEKYGGAVDKFEFEQRRKELEAAALRLDERVVGKCITELEAMNLKILFKQDWFWRDIFESMDRSESAFSNPTAARHWVVEAERAIREGKGDVLRDAIRKLWALQPVGAAVAAQQRALRTGIRS